jgi:hypothetical protein
LASLSRATFSLAGETVNLLDLAHLLARLEMTEKRTGGTMGLRILIADDALFMRNMLKEIFVNAGFQVVGEAANGIEAVERYHELRPDLVTMDIVMPLKSGIEALQQITREDPDARVSHVQRTRPGGAGHRGGPGRGQGFYRQAIQGREGSRRGATGNQKSRMKEEG